jgi:PAS domain S-box-containing protein
MSRVWRIRHQMAPLGVLLGCTIILFITQSGVAQEGRLSLRAQPVATDNSSPQHVFLLFSGNPRLDGDSIIKRVGLTLLQSSQPCPDIFVATLEQLHLHPSESSSSISGSTILAQASIEGYISVWERYYHYISGGVLIAVAEAALIILLLVQWKRRKQAQATLERRFAIERVITELSTKLVDCVPQRLDIEIESGLRKLLDAENVDQVTWCAVPKDATWKTHVVQRAGVESSPVFPPEMPWFIDRLLKGETVAVTRARALPDTAASEREYLSKRRVESVIEVPCALGNGTKGVLGLACVAHERLWPITLINRLVVLGNVIGDALLRKKSGEAERASEQRFRYLFEQAPVGMALEDFEGRLLVVNPALCSMLGYSEEEMLALRCDQFANPEDSADDWKLFQELSLGLRQSYQIEKRYSRKDGRKVWGRLNVSRLRFQIGRAPLVLAIVEDITDRREAEEKLKQAQAVLHDLPSRLIQAQEEERQRIARELHDDIGQRLSLLMVELEQVNRELPVFPIEHYGNFAAVLQGIDELTTDVHHLSHQLHSSKLQYLGLKAALRELCQQIATQHEITIFEHLDDVPDLTSDMQLCLYRVAQEALNNVVRHSSSETAYVRLTENHGISRLEISDIGIGFDLGSTSEGLGLASMRERLRSINGTFSITSSPGRGTQIVAEIPYEVDTGLAKAS